MENFQLKNMSKLETSKTVDQKSDSRTLTKADSWLVACLLFSLSLSACVCVEQVQEIQKKKRKNEKERFFKLSI